MPVPSPVESRAPSRRIVPLALLSLALVSFAGLTLAGAARAGEGRLLMTWNAPYGQPGATDRVDPVCGDSTRADTLYLCAYSGRRADVFVGFTGRLYFHAAPGDTLSDYWHFPSGRGPRSNLQVLMDSDSIPGTVRPIAVPGRGAIDYQHNRYTGTLRFVYAIARQVASPAADSTLYCLARIAFRHPGGREAGCDQPVCIEWQEATLAFGIEGGEISIKSGDQRFVCRSSPRGKVCAPFIAGHGARPWRRPDKR